MPFYTVEVTIKTTMVVQAEDENDARDAAYEHHRQAIDDERPDPMIDVRGEVTRETDLRHGWDGDCVPYGGDRNTRLCDLLQK